MKAFVQCDANSIPVNVNTYAAWQGFHHLGYEVIPFENIETVTDREPSDVVCGSIRQVLRSLDVQGTQKPPLLDYPDELAPYLGRKVWQTTLGEIRAPEVWPVFVKPVITHKAFTGQVIRVFRDLLETCHIDDDLKIYAAEPIDFTSEYRVFVRRGEILGCRNYKGAWFAWPDKEVIESAIRDYKSAPCAYSLDVGVTDKGETLLVEVNDFYSLGSYGLDPILYATAIADRWSEIVSTVTQP